jgi:DNA/RNA-binding domain of Phe-tRNA-synthetase-like protein
MTDQLDLSPAAGFIAEPVRAELPGLRLDWVSLRVRRRRTPPEVKRRLGELSTRFRGANAVTLRTQPVAHAYRAFFRQIGLDPDVTRIPSEQAVLARMLLGEFRSENLIADALLISLVETGVPVWALDADVVDAGGLGIRTSRPDEQLGKGAMPSRLSPGTLVVADARRVHALLFGEVARAHAVSRRTSHAVLYSVGVRGVPAIHIEEALWLCADILADG